VIKDLRVVLEMDREHSEAWRSLGKAYRSVGRFADELVCYKEAIRWAKTPSVKRDLEKWTLKLQDKQKQSPHKATSQELNSIFEKARAAQRSGDIDKAIMLYDSGLKLEPGNSSIYLALGELYFTASKPSNALECYDKALILDPADLKLRAKFASFLYEVGDKERAATEYEKILKKDPANPGIYIQLGQIRLEQGRKNDALILWKKAEELTSDSKKKSELASLMAQLRETSSAQSSVVEKDRNDPVDEPKEESTTREASARQFQSKASAAEQSEDWNQAIFYYLKAVELDPNNPDYHYSVGVIREILGDWHAAADEYEEAVRLKSDHVEALVALADINSMILDDGKAALKYYKRAVENARDMTTRERITKRIEILENNL